MSSAGRIVLISRDAGLRSGLAARLGMAGFALVTVDADGATDDHASGARVLILDASSLANDAFAGAGPARESGRVILIGGDDPAPADGIVRVERRHAVDAVLAQLNAWR